MKKYLLLVFVLFVAVLHAWCKESIDPTISPSLFRYNTSITVTYDVTGTPLANLSNAYAWVWIPGVNIDAKYNVNPASSDVTKTNNAKFTKSVVDGRTLFTLTFVPADFFASDISAQTQMGILLKGNSWDDGQTSDYLASFWNGGFQISLTSPTKSSLFVHDGDDIQVTAETPVDADFSLFVNDQLVTQTSASKTFSYTLHVAVADGNGVVRVVAETDASSSEETFQYIISTASPVADKPSGIIPGINYGPDNTKVTLCLWAPDKESVYVIGDFTDWEISPDYLMNRSGEFFWITIEGLTAQQEYGFQYLIDESIYVADPYADKILDPDDQYIPESIYPSLKDYPAKALKNDSYFNRVSVLQTGQQSYSWKVTDFQKPAKEKLVIYELLIRDFFENGQRSYKNLIDTISYFKRLGVNAIELMPIMEFNGNESWGYNPTFMFAPDKYYGTKNDLKAFVDACHQNGLAVILDIALNHQDIPNTYVMMDFDFETGQPQPDNKWFNVTATHPFSVFFDMNHESSYTKKYVDTINYYWLNEYKVDGYRFDLSKGFTQKNNPNDVNAWSAYDASRIAILKRMADKIWEHNPDAYVILEHLAANQEEKELAEFRADEGMGMMPWGKMTDQYNQLTMGFVENSDISKTSAAAREWSAQRLVGYMESHDEERLMFKNESYGNATGTYSVKDTTTALMRQVAANVLFFSIPGPKMFWQFGEVGYDYSINYCEDGTINTDCRISPKPVRWDYANEKNRKYLFKQISDMLRLRNEYDVFTNGAVEFSSEASLVKQIRVKHEPYSETPASAADMNLVSVANFDVVAKDASVTFPHNGTWYEYFTGEEVSVSASSATVNLTPGAYRLFTDVAIAPSTITSIEHTGNPQREELIAYPNPTKDVFKLNASGVVNDITMYSSHGTTFKPSRIDAGQWNVENLPDGLYILKIKTSTGWHYSKLIKR